MKAWGIPLVVMVRTLGSGSYDFAGSDNARGVQMATEHLISTGHRRIGFLGGQSGPVLDQRLQGYKAALAEAGIAFDEGLVFACQPHSCRGLRDDEGAAGPAPAGQAAVCYNDLAAFGALSALGERGLHAGTDFALMGFDNVLDAAHSNPPLSTVDIRPSELGEQAASILLARIEDPSQAKRQYVALPKLILRQSG